MERLRDGHADLRRERAAHRGIAGVPHMRERRPTPPGDDDAGALMIDLGWANTGGSIEAEIEGRRAFCMAAGHRLKDIDHSNHRGTDHEVCCEPCGYKYHYDSGD